MRVSMHVAASAVLGGGLFLYTRSAVAGLACFFSGFLVDVDHLLDYWVNHGLRFNVGHFFYVFRKEPLKKILVLFHAWEWVLILLAAVLLTKGNMLFTGLFVGIGSHMFFDQVVNKHSAFAYFLIFRIRSGFEGAKFHGPGEYARRCAGKAVDREL